MSDRTCAVTECDRKYYAKGYCANHWRRWKRTGVAEKATPEDRFWAKVDKTNSCWNWTGYLDKEGYGSFWTGSRHSRPHRFAYELMVSSIPAGLEIDHVCHNRACVHPGHLRPVTSKQNGENRPGPTRRSKSGARGVFPHGKRWAVYVGHRGKSIYAGVFDTVEEAAEAARLKRLELFTHSDMDLIETG